LIDELEAQANGKHFELTPPPPGYVPKGITEEIRTVLRLTPVHLTATQIRDAILERGVRSKNRRNLLINVHTILRRIKEELSVEAQHQKPRYKMIGYLAKSFTNRRQKESVHDL
jgi:hypothetical protein